ncbi:YciI family protein [Methylobacterium iners]|nr:YciI family protein [Methylobacterium iners]
MPFSSAARPGPYWKVGIEPMQYMLIYKETDAQFAEREDPEKAGPYWGAWTAYIGAIAQAGVMVSGNGLQGPHAATTIRVRDGRREVQDGPYADAKEQLGGYVIVEAPDLDAALEWAARAPSAAYASVEVRPVLPPPAP